MLSFEKWYWYRHGKPQTEEERGSEYNEDWNTADSGEKFNYLLYRVEELDTRPGGNV